jgi:hypothetical protein
LESIAKVGGGYGDWVRLVRECQELGLISIPVAMNPVPGAILQETSEEQSESGQDAIPEVTSSDSPDQQNSSDPDAHTPWYTPRFWWPTETSEPS